MSDILIRGVELVEPNEILCVFPDGFVGTLNVEYGLYPIHPIACAKAVYLQNSDRISYAMQQFEKHNIEYTLKNEQTGHFHCRRKSDDKLFQFYAGTGKIQGVNMRGIHALIRLLETEE